MTALTQWRSAVERAAPLVARPGYFVLAGLVAGAGWGADDSLAALGSIFLLFTVWPETRDRREAYIVALSYFLAGSRGLIFGVGNFFGDSGWIGAGLLLWAFCSASLALPYSVLWLKSPLRKAAGFVAASLALLIPPIAYFGWTNPISIAGLLFPGLGLVGLSFTVASMYFYIGRRWRALCPILVVAISCNIFTALEAKSVPISWRAIDTGFNGLASGGHDDPRSFLAAYQRIAWVERIESSISSGELVLLPETLLGRLDPISESMLEPIETRLRGKRSKIVVGAELPQKDGSYLNALIVLGSEPGQNPRFIQRIPVPIGMWTPWADGGAVAQPLEVASLISLDGLTVAAAICYEQLLPLSLLQTFAAKPDLVFGVSNVWWASSTNIPSVQQQTLAAFARLFSRPLIISRNV